MKYAIALIVSAVLLFQTNPAAATSCGEITKGLDQTKILLIEYSGNLVVAKEVLQGSEELLNQYMSDLNAVAYEEKECETSELSAEIAQGLQAVSNLRDRNAGVKRRVHSF